MPQGRAGPTLGSSVSRVACFPLWGSMVWRRATKIMLPQSGKHVTLLGRLVDQAVEDVALIQGPARDAAVVDQEPGQLGDAQGLTRRDVVGEGVGDRLVVAAVTGQRFEFTRL